ncbi:unnamed protein product [Linum trigynum]|uniref:Receptor-like serine/threonine-protein kinase n=1 Tax=Linum trigynum TaxID=586398 RepID=A0AAV2C8E3_9ROSI
MQATGTYEKRSLLLLCAAITWGIAASPVSSLDTISTVKSIADGETIVSSGESFEMGFFSPGSSAARYLGMWYKKNIPASARTVVWVANREAPISDRSGVLTVTSQGILVLLNGTGDSVWSTNSSADARIDGPVAQLLDSGNLVVRNGDDLNPANYIWQSFDYPADTLLPGMKLGRNLAAGRDWFIRSWKSTDDPSPGDYVVWMDPRGYPQLVLKKEESLLYRGGPWNGLSWTGTPALKQNPVCYYLFVISPKEVSYSYELRNSSVVSRLVIQPSGILQRFTWIEQTQSWRLFYATPIDQCDTYGFCGAYSRCNINAPPLCACLPGFVPKSFKDWSLLDFSDGCVRKSPLACNYTDGFLQVKGMKLPDTTTSWVDKAIGLRQCGQLCAKNCTCTAYANSDVEGGGSGCLLWFSELMDIREFTEGGQDLYIRMAAADLESVAASRRPNDKAKVGIIVSCTVVAIALLILGFVLCARRRRAQRKANECLDDGDDEEMELPAFDLVVIKNATGNFLSDNKLGEGGFGAVYKGTLADGCQIAVKRLSKSSGQGDKEFKNEVILIAKLQHRNLVKLLGCCIKGDEKLLIYEYMANKSLDSFIFDEERGKLLDWSMRFQIIIGIARGLLYLHQDSRLRIIHRDLKASNVLLDTDMNPKISDFGLAKTFGRDQSVANTKRVVGTYGYMSPEYAVDGLFSVKSDVFSFGVLVLEIISGKRNRGFCHPDHGLNLLGHAWRLWMEEKAAELTDEKILGAEVSSSVPGKVVRCIHIGLLCVQKLPEDRPNMGSVVMMLGSDEKAVLPRPKQPGFYMERNPFEDSDGYYRCQTSSSNGDSCSRNQMTTTELYPR